jgi:hypothetical protein
LNWPVKYKTAKMAWNILRSAKHFSLSSTLVILALFVHSISCEKGKDIDVKDIAEEWFTQQAVGLLGKKFLEKVKCSKFVSYFQEKYPDHYGTSAKHSKDQVASVVSDVSPFYTPDLHENDSWLVQSTVR